MYPRDMSCCCAGQMFPRRSEGQCLPMSGNVFKSPMRESAIWRTSLRGIPTRLFACCCELRKANCRFLGMFINYEMMRAKRKRSLMIGLSVPQMVDETCFVLTATLPTQTKVKIFLHYQALTLHFHEEKRGFQDFQFSQFK